MFCPNCGNNCGDARFCPSCGTQLQQAAAPATQSGEWKVGMPCPNCGATKLNGDCCAFCGAQLVLTQSIEMFPDEDSFTLPQITLSCAGSSDIMMLNEDSFTYRSNLPFSKKFNEYTVAYADIKVLKFFRKHDEYTRVTIIDESRKRRKTEITSTSKSCVLYQWFCFLRTRVSDGIKIEIDDRIRRKIDNQEWLQRFDTDDFFSEYNPDQDRAKKRIIQLTGLPEIVAYPIASEVICRRQDELYKTNPAMAIRDLNRAIRVYVREKEEDFQKKEENLKESRKYRH